MKTLFAALVSAGLLTSPMLGSAQELDRAARGPAKGILVRVDSSGHMVAYRSNAAAAVRNDRDAMNVIATTAIPQNEIRGVKRTRGELDRTTSHESWYNWWGIVPSYGYGYGYGYPYYGYGYGGGYGYGYGGGYPYYGYGYGCNYYGQSYYYYPYYSYYGHGYGWNYYSHY